MSHTRSGRATALDLRREQWREWRHQPLSCWKRRALTLVKTSAPVWIILVANAIAGISAAVVAWVVAVAYLALLTLHTWIDVSPARRRMAGRIIGCVKEPGKRWAPLGLLIAWVAVSPFVGPIARAALFVLPFAPFVWREFGNSWRKSVGQWRRNLNTLECLALAFFWLGLLVEAVSPS